MAYFKLGFSLLSGLLAAALQASSVAAQEKNVRFFSGASTLGTVERLVTGFDKSIKAEILSDLDGNRIIYEFCSAPNYEQKILIIARRMSHSEMKKCEHAANDGAGLVGFQFASLILGLGSNSSSLVFDATPKMLYLAIADYVPRSAVDKSNLPITKRINLLSDNLDNYIHNPFRTWRDIDASLPDIEIHFILPEAGSSRILFDSQILEVGCRNFKEVKEIFSAELRRKICTNFRREGVVTITKGAAFGAANQNAKNNLLGVSQPAIGLLFPEHLHGEGITPLTINGMSPVTPNFDHFNFQLRRDVSVYFFEQGVFGKGPSQEASPTALALKYLMSEQVIGPEGQFVKDGFLIIDPKERQKFRHIIHTSRGSSNIGVD